MATIKRRCDLKILNAIRSSEEWLDKHRDYKSVDDNLNFTIAGCERRNLTIMREMLQTKVGEWTVEQKQLFKAL